MNPSTSAGYQERQELELDVTERWARREDLALLTDFYQLTMLSGYYRSGRAEVPACFEYFFRSLPPDAGFGVFAGLEQLLDLIENLHFNERDLEYLTSLGTFDDAFLRLLREFKPTATVYAAPEGSIVFPQEPIVRVEAPLAEAQLLETALLNSLNYPTLVATKAARLRQAAGEDYVMEFGVRRAQGPDGGLTGTRATFIGGADATSNVLAGKIYGIPVRGTHAHSWVMSFEDELAAFRAYAELFPENTLLLVDTYDTLTSGLPNAVRVFQEMRARGHTGRVAIRLDSGDIAKLSKAAHKMLTEAGFDNPLIVASNELDVDLIADLKRQGAKVNSWGVGTHLITASDAPALGGIYKLTAVKEPGGNWEPKLKTSSNPAKSTDPGPRRVVRHWDAEGRPLGDTLHLVGEGEQAPGSSHPDATSAVVTYADRMDPTFLRRLEGVATSRNLLELVMVGGARTHPSPPLVEVKERATREVASLPEEYRRLRNPHLYTVGLSPDLARVKNRLIRKLSGLNGLVQ